jgi:outer membrane protein assembly factor BamB
MNSWVAILTCGLMVGTTTADDWPQWRGPNRDGVWREDNVLEKFPAEGLEFLWRVKIGAGYCGPTVADNRVFCMDRISEPTELERVLCFDAKTGDELWTVPYECRYRIQYPAGPRASVTVDDDRAYALGAMGHLHCLDVGTGTILWNKDLAEQFQDKKRMPTWGIAGAPLIVDDLVIVQLGAENACIIALDKESGDPQWQSLNDRGGYSAPILIEQAGQPVVVCWTGDSVAGLAPSSGEVLWRIPFAPSEMPIGVATPIVKDNKLFVTSFYDGSLMLRLGKDQPTAEQLWKKQGPDEYQTEALHSIISTPIWLDNYIYGVDSYGQLRCLRAATGERVWEDQTATPKARWSTIHFVKHDDQIWMFNERGELIIGELSAQGFREIDRTQLLKPTTSQLPQRGGVCWAHPAFANQCVFARNDEELVCASLKAE